MENKVKFYEEGFDIKKAPRNEGLITHVCYYDDTCYAQDLNGELSMDLTAEMLDRYLAYENSDKAVKLIEVWYMTIHDVLVEQKRRETTYAKGYFLTPPAPTTHMDTSPGNLDDLPF